MENKYKLRFVNRNDYTYDQVRSSGNNNQLELTLKRSKDWSSVIDYLYKKWSNISNLPERLKLFYVDINGKDSVDLISTFQRNNVWDSLKTHPTLLQLSTQLLNSYRDNENSIVDEKPIIQLFYTISNPNDKPIKKIKEKKEPKQKVMKQVEKKQQNLNSSSSSSTLFKSQSQDNNQQEKEKTKKKIQSVKKTKNNNPHDFNSIVHNQAYLLSNELSIPFNNSNNNELLSVSFLSPKKIPIRIDNNNDDNNYIFLQSSSDINNNIIVNNEDSLGGELLNLLDCNSQILFMNNPAILTKEGEGAKKMSTTSTPGTTSENSLETDDRENGGKLNNHSNKTLVNNNNNNNNNFSISSFDENDGIHSYLEFGFSNIGASIMGMGSLHANSSKNNFSMQNQTKSLPMNNNIIETSQINNTIIDSSKQFHSSDLISNFSFCVDDMKSVIDSKKLNSNILIPTAINVLAGSPIIPNIDINQENIDNNLRIINTNNSRSNKDNINSCLNNDQDNPKDSNKFSHMNSSMRLFGFIEDENLKRSGSKVKLNITSRTSSPYPFVVSPVEKDIDDQINQVYVNNDIDNIKKTNNTLIDNIIQNSNNDTNILQSSNVNNIEIITDIITDIKESIPLNKIELLNEVKKRKRSTKSKINESSNQSSMNQMNSNTINKKYCTSSLTKPHLKRITPTFIAPLCDREKFYSFIPVFFSNIPAFNN